MNRFKERSTSAEFMDDHRGDKDLLFSTLRQFDLINRLFSRNRFLARSLILPHLVRRRSRSCTVCDLGSGGCDFARWLSRCFSALSIDAHIICVDNDPRVVEYAKLQCASYPAIQVEECGAAEFLKRGMPIDYIFANHFLHHIADADLIELMRLIHKSSRHGYLLNDLRRSWKSYLLFSVFAAIFTRKSFARADGLLSIRKSFTAEELQSRVQDAGIFPTPCVRKLFPCRLVVQHFS